jgi:thiol-disulfide isomerase/thioredoxin
MATWCGPCLEELPRLARLRSRFPEEQLEMIGVPIDPEDTPAALEAWAGEEPLPYRLLSELPASERERVQRLVVELRGQDAVPATLITDASGRLLETLWGPPSLSLVRRLLEPVVAPE